MQKGLDMIGKTGLALALSLAALGAAGTGSAAASGTPVTVSGAIAGPADGGGSREQCDTATAHEQSRYAGHLAGALRMNVRWCWTAEDGLTSYSCFASESALSLLLWFPFGGPLCNATVATPQQLIIYSRGLFTQPRRPARRRLLPAETPSERGPPGAGPGGDAIARMARPAPPPLPPPPRVFTPPPNPASV
jgi:hypothetical protein